MAKIEKNTIKGHLFIVMGPSGCGKSTLIEYILTQRPDLHFPISATTRLPRGGETDGKEYYFFDKQQYEDKIKNGDFLEYALVHGKTYYGTLLSEVVIPLQVGTNVIRHIDYQGVQSIWDLLPKDQVHVIYVDAGGWEKLSARIQSRVELSELELERRRQSFVIEEQFKTKADFIIGNQDGDLEKAQEELLSIIDSFVTL